MVTASRRKFRILVPNLTRASSAASSAFSTSLKRLVASARNRDMRPSDSLRASLSVRSLSGSCVAVATSRLSAAVVGGVSKASGFDNDLARLTIEDLKSVNPFNASSLAAVAS